MIGVIAVAVVLGLAGWLLTRELRRTLDGHAFAGLLGEPERDRIISRRAAALINAAELCTRLAAFSEAVKTYAWMGTPMRMRRRSAQWSEWVFADGHVWRVRQSQRLPRRAPRMVVQHAAPTDDGGVAVTAYGPCGAYPTVALDVSDVRAVR